ncbi:hypothetical protein PTTG_27779 [Puccinia triticina 1-1 BBBD Race 1]|uniref:Uncharacterized protein n=2 Tax=Puccinia triticina TaxID=208348 RepID=A0A180GH64_PUCT1|nr:uncharacterized protein PtA15_18A414 [Puccinia triticina]OAV92086.1 hypothetical protein PTTG_27779 [Puccinia triticina 1-1 BBBD Race 1]WAQ93354.1 hypothetical protein PtA15_18A414 [Puccinia triticina]
MRLPYYLLVFGLISQLIIDTDAQIGLPNHAEGYLLEHVTPRTAGYFYPCCQYNIGSHEAIAEFKNKFDTLPSDHKILHVNRVLTYLLKRPETTSCDHLLGWCEALAGATDPAPAFERINIATIYAFHTFILQKYEYRKVRTRLQQIVKNIMSDLLDHQDTRAQWARELYHPEEGLSELFKEKEQFRNVWLDVPMLENLGASIYWNYQDSLATEMDKNIGIIFSLKPSGYISAQTRVVAIAALWHVLNTNNVDDVNKTKAREFLRLLVDPKKYFLFDHERRLIQALSNWEIL